MDEPTERRKRMAKETLDAVQRAHPHHHPSVEDIAHLHEVHAKHEREAGHEAQAAAAEERARQARERGH